MLRRRHLCPLRRLLGLWQLLRLQLRLWLRLWLHLQLQLQQPQQQLCVQEVAVATLPKGEVQSSQAVVQQVVAGVAPTANALQTETRPILRACAAFTASSSSQLTLSVADLVEIVERHASGWTYGRKVSDVRGEGAAEGWFPDWVVPNQHAAQK
mmetsp:Transcript_129759/g.336546  ORF Transcript_129759/g.336546 Transcript_129759/m.336546 type:complete len:154 (-) Transcript_129759:87-548(-)